MENILFLKKNSVLQGSGRCADVLARAYEETEGDENTLDDERFVVSMELVYNATQVSAPDTFNS